MKDNQRSRSKIKKVKNDVDSLTSSIEAPVAASSPKSQNSSNMHLIDAFIEEQRQVVEKLKREINRVTRIQILKIGTSLGQLPFTKTTVSQGLLENFNKVLSESKGKIKNEELKSISFNLNNDGDSVLSSIASGIDDKSTKIEDSLNFSKATTKKTHSVTFKDDSVIKKREPLKQRLPLNENIITQLRKSSRKLLTDKENTSPRPGLLKKNFKRPFHEDEMISNTTEEGSDENEFKTPVKRNKNLTVAAVTPGPNLNRPVSVLRRPEAGEMAISLAGSPLLIGLDVGPTTLPQINLPTADGKVVAILPRDGFVVEDLPALNNSTKRQLKTLSRHLNNICNL